MYNVGYGYLKDLCFTFTKMALPLIYTFAMFLCIPNRVTSLESKIMLLRYGNTLHTCQCLLF